jgi:hypothetical protein
VLGPFYGGFTSPVQVMTLAELQFILAEASFKNSDLTTAASASNAGAVASVTSITGSAPPAGWTLLYASETNLTISLQKIMTQKYIALFLNPETFSDWRRTAFPALTQVAGSSTNGIPRRYYYAETETERNSNTPRSVQLTDRVWWDVP